MPNPESRVGYKIRLCINSTRSPRPAPSTYRSQAATHQRQPTIRHPSAMAYTRIRLSLRTFPACISPRSDLCSISCRPLSSQSAYLFPSCPRRSHRGRAFSSSALASQVRPQTTRRTFPTTLDPVDIGGIPSSKRLVWDSAEEAIKDIECGSLILSAGES